MTRILALALFLAPAAAAAQMYKCVDARGVTTYSDKPCPDAKGAQVDIKGQPPISGKLQERKENLKREEAEFNRRQKARDREIEKDRAAQQRRCNQLRQEQKRLAAARRPVQVDAKGQRSVMDDQARDKKLAELSDQLRGCP